MSWVQVSGLKVWLTSAKRRLQTSKVTKCRNSVCSVKKLSNTNSSSAPVTCCQSVTVPVSYYSRTYSSRYSDKLSFNAHALKLIFYVSTQVPESNPEQVSKQWTSKFEAFVFEVVFVVLFSDSKFKFNDSASHFT